MPRGGSRARSSSEVELGRYAPPRPFMFTGEAGPRAGWPGSGRALQPLGSSRAVLEHWPPRRPPQRQLAIRSVGGCKVAATPPPVQHAPLSCRGPRARPGAAAGWSCQKRAAPPPSGRSAARGDLPGGRARARQRRAEAAQRPAGGRPHRKKQRLPVRALPAQGHPSCAGWYPVTGESRPLAADTHQAASVLAMVRS